MKPWRPGPMEEIRPAEQYAEPEPRERRQHVALSFTLGLLVVGAMITLVIAFLRWGPALLEKRGLAVGIVATPVQKEERPQMSPARYAEVVNTGGTALRLRAEPRLEAQVVAGLPEGTVVTIEAGPIQADGYEWWKVRYGEQQGWCAANWLRTIEPTEGPKR